MCSSAESVCCADRFDMPVLARASLSMSRIRLSMRLRTMVYSSSERFFRVDELRLCHTATKCFLKYVFGEIR